MLSNADKKFIEIIMLTASDEAFERLVEKFSDEAKAHVTFVMNNWDPDELVMKLIAEEFDAHKPEEN